MMLVADPRIGRLYTVSHNGFLWRTIAVRLVPGARVDAHAAQAIARALDACRLSPETRLGLRPASWDALPLGFPPHLGDVLLDDHTVDPRQIDALAEAEIAGPEVIELRGLGLSAEAGFAAVVRALDGLNQAQRRGWGNAWPFAAQHPAGHRKFWGSPRASSVHLKPLLRPGPHTVGDGHPPDIARPILVPADTPVTDLAQDAGRNAWARAIVLRSAMIAPARHDPCDWQLLGYRVEQDGVTLGYADPELRPLAVDPRTQRQPGTTGMPTSTPPSLSVSTHDPVLSIIPIALAAESEPDDDEVLHILTTASAAQVNALTLWCRQFVGMLAINLHREASFYRAYGAALAATVPVLADAQVDAVRRIVDGSIVEEACPGVGRPENPVLTVAAALIGLHHTCGQAISAPEDQT